MSEDKNPDITLYVLHLPTLKNIHEYHVVAVSDNKDEVQEWYDKYVVEPYSDNSNYIKCHRKHSPLEWYGSIDSTEESGIIETQLNLESLIVNMKWQALESAVKGYRTPPAHLPGLDKYIPRKQTKPEEQNETKV
ncbi:MAG: hypothetical protein JNL32_02365 [Candidatus Kapabacteria bacterium]|nr:hypothetical protein [Candidatus Kapabacteria bacterium]